MVANLVGLVWWKIKTSQLESTLGLIPTHKKQEIENVGGKILDPNSLESDGSQNFVSRVEYLSNAISTIPLRMQVYSD